MMLFLAALMNVRNSEVYLIGEWSILAAGVNKRSTESRRFSSGSFYREC